MNEKVVNITFDYELFFGANTGTIQNCLINPTNRLIDLAKKKNAKFVFFIDAGYLFKLNQFSNYDKADSDLNLITEQLRLLVREGHEIGLHIHPHWEDCSFDGKKWIIKTERYKLSDFKPDQVEEIVDKYCKSLEDIIGKKISSFRAGGWCIQPFAGIKNALLKNNLLIDSTVYKNGYHQFTAHAYDFRKAPDLSEWKFSDNECVIDEKGAFLELAITPDRIPPQFYYSLYFKMRVDPGSYKPEGDGEWLKDKKRIYRQFHSSTAHFACCDGYFASRLIGILDKQIDKGQNRMVVLGHPKSLAKCSYAYLEKFIDRAKALNFEVKTFT